MHPVRTYSSPLASRRDYIADLKVFNFEGLSLLYLERYCDVNQLQLRAWGDRYDSRRSINIPIGEVREAWHYHTTQGWHQVVFPVPEWDHSLKASRQRLSSLWIMSNIQSCLTAGCEGPKDNRNTINSTISLAAWFVVSSPRPSAISESSIVFFTDFLVKKASSIFQKEAGRRSESLGGWPVGKSGPSCNIVRRSSWVLKRFCSSTRWESDHISLDVNDTPRLLCSRIRRCRC